MQNASPEKTFPPLASERSEKPRFAGIETVRVLAILGVLCLHAEPLARVSWTGHILLSNLSLFGVPFFFIVMGYFFGKQNAPLPAAFRICRRLLILFLGWSLFYLLIPSKEFRSLEPGVSAFSDFAAVWPAHFGNALGSLLEHPLGFLMQGTKYHLWFLMSGIWGLVILTGLLHWKKDRWILPLTFGLYGIGMAAKAYSGFTHFHLPMNFDTRNGPFLSALFIAIGWKLSKSQKNVSFLHALLIAAAGFALQLSENLFLWKTLGVFPLETLFGTVIFGTGIFLAALAKPDFGERTPLPGFAKATLGIYGIHLFWTDLLYPLAALAPWAWAFFSVSFIYLLSYQTVKAFRRTPLLHHLVS